MKEDFTRDWNPDSHLMSKEIVRQPAIQRLPPGMTEQQFEGLTTDGSLGAHSCPNCRPNPRVGCSTFQTFFPLSCHWPGSGVCLVAKTRLAGRRLFHCATQEKCGEASELK